MRSPSLLSGPKIRKAYFEASNPKNLLHRPQLKSDFRVVIEVNFLDLKPQAKKALRIFGPGKSDGLLILLSLLNQNNTFIS